MDTASESVGGTKGNNGCKMSVCKKGSQEMAAAPVDSVTRDTGPRVFRITSAEFNITIKRMRRSCDGG